MKNLITTSLRARRVPCLLALALGLTAPTLFAQPFNINPTSRETSRVFFNTVYQASENVPINWTGNAATCTPGTVSQAYLDATALRINYFRAMSGVPAITLTASNNLFSQATALLMSANRDIEHNPPMNWTCYNQVAADGAAANLNIGSTGPKAIDSFMHDGGDNNARAGHRRSTMGTRQLTMGSGNVPETEVGDYPATAALWVHDVRAAQRPVVRDDFVAWPPKGFSPYQVVYPRWSLDYTNADFSAATVTMTRNGAPVPVQINSRETTSEPGIVWIVNNLNNNANWPRPAADETYTVTVGNVVVNGTPRIFTYDVTVFDPSIPGPDYMPPVVTGPDTATLNQNTAYNFTAVPNATAYQWRTTKLTPLNLTDGAEAGLANFTANITGGYNPVVTNVKATGNAGFNLRLPGGEFAPQSLVFNRTLQVDPNSQITFKSRLALAASLSARVEVSSDGGQTWTAVFTQAGMETGEAVFTDKVVPLATHAGKQILLRFSLIYTGGPKFSCCDPLGWYFDDIAFVNLNEALNPVVANVPAGTTFNFNPTEQSGFALAVRPQVFGNYFSDWGPVKRVTAGTPLPPTALMIGTQPQGQTVNVGANLNFNVTATGTGPLTYGWRKDGVPLTDGAGIAGSTTATLMLQNVQAAQAGSYVVGVTNTSGNAQSTPAVLVVNQAATLSSALDTTGLNWATAGTLPWVIQTTVTHDNVDAAKSGAITHSQQSTLETMITGPATVAFWWKVESEQNYDFLSVELDGTMQFRISGNVNWEQKTVAVPAGAHTLRWVFAKDGSVSTGGDAGWLDQVKVRTAQPPPSLADALDTTAITWAATGDRPWFAQTATMHDGTDAVQSGPIADNQASRLEATILGPANLSFWWKVDSEQNYDYLTFQLDNAEVAAAPKISGNVNWEQKTVPIPAGTHTVRWTYSKDGSVGSGADAGWVDQVVMTKLTPGEAGEPGPLLQFTPSGNKLRITWPEVATNFKLQSATASGGPWVDVSENDIFKEEGEFYIIVNTGVESAFYRLIALP